MLPLKYTGQVIARAAQGTVQLTDRLSVLIVPFTTLVLWVLGARMTSTVSETVALGVAITVIATVLLRLLAATYFIWKDDLAEKERLQRLLDRPGQLEREAAWQYTISLRNRLSDSLSRVMAIVEMTKLYARHDNARGTTDEYFEEVTKTRQLINALSYDVSLRVCANKLLTTITQIMVKAISGDDTPDLELLLMQQKKIAFRVIHKRDFNETDEMLSMMEMENLTAGDEGPAPPLPSASEPNARKLLEGIRKNLKDPEVLEGLRSYIKSRGANSL